MSATNRNTNHSIYVKTSVAKANLCTLCIQCELQTIYFKTLISAGGRASKVIGHLIASRSCVAIVAACRFAQTPSCSLVYQTNKTNQHCIQYRYSLRTCSITLPVLTDYTDAYNVLSYGPSTGIAVQMLCNGLWQCMVPCVTSSGVKEPSVAAVKSYSYPVGATQ